MLTSTFHMHTYKNTYIHEHTQKHRGNQGQTHFKTVLIHPNISMIKAPDISMRSKNQLCPKPFNGLLPSSIWSIELAPKRTMAEQVHTPHILITFLFCYLYWVVGQRGGWTLIKSRLQKNYAYNLCPSLCMSVAAFVLLSTYLPMSFLNMEASKLLFSLNSPLLALKKKRFSCSNQELWWFWME